MANKRRIAVGSEAATIGDEPSTAPLEESRAFEVADIVWQGISLTVSYEADYLSSAARGLHFTISHLELRVTAPVGAPLPVTETGYRSHFLPPGTIEEAGGPSAFIQAWLNEASRSVAWQRTHGRWRQLKLFD
jgi:hypothetical protein